MPRASPARYHTKGQEESNRLAISFGLSCRDCVPISDLVPPAGGERQKVACHRRYPDDGTADLRSHSKPPHVALSDPKCAVMWCSKLEGA